MLALAAEWTGMTGRNGWEQAMDQSPRLVTDLLMPEREGGYAKGYETRELILRTALHILIEDGYRAMSMRRIATACVMRLGNLTYHYPTRDDLVQ